MSCKNLWLFRQLNKSRGDGFAINIKIIAGILNIWVFLFIYVIYLFTSTVWNFRIDSRSGLNSNLFFILNYLLLSMDIVGVVQTSLKYIKSVNIPSSYCKYFNSWNNFWRTYSVLLVNYFECNYLTCRIWTLIQSVFGFCVILRV